MKFLKQRLAKLPKTEWDLKNGDLTRVQPKIKIWENEKGNTTVCLSSEQGNMSSFEYLEMDYIVDIKPELQEWAKQYGWVWECQCQGTYFLREEY